MRISDGVPDCGKPAVNIDNSIIFCQNRTGLIRQSAMRIILSVLLLCGFLSAVEAQTLRPGDSISISVYQDPKLDRQLTISPGGMISLPLAGHIRAAGLTPTSLEDALKARLREKFSGDLDITVALLGSKPIDEDSKPRIFVTGEVLRPGPYTMRPRTNVMQAISLAGGFGPFAAKHRIQVRRNISGADAIFVFNYEAYFSGSNMIDNIDLRPGDVVIVPERGLLE